MRWSELSLPALEGSLPRVVLVGGEEVELAGAGLELERYPDLGALARAIDDGAAAPELVLTVPSGGVAGGEGGVAGGEGGVAGGEGGVAGGEGGVAGGEGGVAGGVGEVEEGWGALASSVHVLAGRTLALLKEWLSDERFADSRLLLVTHGAVPLALRSGPILLRQRCGGFSGALILSTPIASVCLTAITAMPLGRRCVTRSRALSLSLRSGAAFSYPSLCASRGRGGGERAEAL